MKQMIGDATDGHQRQADSPLPSTMVLVQLNTGNRGHNFKLFTLPHGQPVELSQGRCDVITAPRTTYKSHVGILDRL